MRNYFSGAVAYKFRVRICSEPLRELHDGAYMDSKGQLRLRSTELVSTINIVTVLHS